MRVTRTLSPPVVPHAPPAAASPASRPIDDEAPSADPNQIPALAHTPALPPNIAFPHKLLQNGEITPASWQRFATAVSTTLHAMAQPGDDARLADLTASLAMPVATLEAMAPVERNRWASDNFRTMAAQCASLSRRTGRGDRDFADFAALLGDLMTELKRQTLLAGTSGELREHGKTAAANLVRQYGVDEVFRPLDATLRANSVGMTGGAGHNWLGKAVACLSTTLGSERRFSFESDSDTQVMQLQSFGFGASLRLGVNALLASLDLSLGGSATSRRGSLTIAPTASDLGAALVKAKHDAAPGTLPIVGRSASPAAREWAAAYRRCRNRIARVASGFRAWAPVEEPYWLSKTSNGFNTARVRELLESLNERANERLPNDHADTLAAMASQLFPLEGEIRAALGPLGSRTVEEIRAIKNGGDDVYAVPAAPSDGATGRRLRNHLRSVEVSIAASARAGSEYVPLGIAAKAGVASTVGQRRIDVQRVQHDLLNLVGIDSTGDPATAYRALSSVQRRLEATVREQYGRLGIDAAGQPARHPYLALLHGTEPEVPASTDLPMPRDTSQSPGDVPVAPMLDFYGRYPDMPAQHRNVLQALLSRAIEPADLLLHVESAYEALYDVACQLHDDTESMQSSSAERREQAMQGINHRVFGGGYDVPSAKDSKSAAEARANLASHAHNALSLAVWNLSLYQMMAKECFADRLSHAPLDDAAKEAWTALAARVDERYLQLKETVVDPLQANRLETTHRLSPVIATAPCERSSLTVTADLSIGSDGLIDMATHRVPGAAGSLLGGLPDGPSLGLGGAVGVTLSDTFRHPNPLKCGQFITSDGSLTAPAGTGVLADVLARTLAGVRDDKGFGSALAFASRGVLGEAVEDIVKHGDFHALLTENRGVAFQVQTRLPPMIDGRQPKPGVQYALLGTTGRKGFSVGLPNLLALTPWTQNGVAEASASTTTSRSNTRVMHVGDDIGYLLLRMSDTGAGRLFKRDKPPAPVPGGSFTASPPESLDFAATRAAFDADRFEKEAIFGSPYQPVLSALITLAEFDPTRPFAKLRDEDGSQSRYISPLASFVKGSRWRVSHIGPWARHFAAGSGKDPFTDPASLGPLDDLAEASLAWKRDDPELLARLRRLKSEMAAWSGDERLRFFTGTEEGRELLSRFWTFVQAHREIIGATFAGSTMEAQANVAVLAAVPTVLEAASRQARSPLRRLLEKLGIGRGRSKESSSETPVEEGVEVDVDYGDDSHQNDADVDVLTAAAASRIRRMTAPAVEAGVSNPFTEQTTNATQSISGKRLDLPGSVGRARFPTSATMLRHGWSAVREMPRALAHAPGAVHRLPGRFLLPPAATQTSTPTTTSAPATATAAPKTVQAAIATAELTS